MAAWNPEANEIFLKAVEIQSTHDRRTYLDEACHSDAALLDQVQALLSAAERAGNFLEAPAPGLTSVRECSPLSERPGSVIGPYKLLQEIGEGGMGVVFMAEQTQPIQRKVALKIIKPGMDTRQVIARFEAERQALAMMDHVNIARVLDAGATDSGRPYFVMELVHGIPITKYCDDNRLTPRERLELFIPVCQAIQHAHQKGIIHRDIKPSNIMITLYDGKPVPKVIDFGVAKATEQRLTERTLFTQYGTMVGTPEYMSPEQAEMSALGADTRSDIFSLGVLLYELLTGSTPLSHKRVKEAAYGEILRMIREEEPPKPSTRLSDSGAALASISDQRHMEPAKLAKLVRGELDWIVLKTLEKDRNRRYDSANSLAEDIERYLNDEPVLACPPSAAYRTRKFARRNRAALLTAGVIASALLLTMAALGVSTVLISAEQKTTNNALQAETHAKGELQKTLNRERIDSYFHRITLAHRELTARIPNPWRAEQILDACPLDQRAWEWKYLKLLWRVEPIVFRDERNSEFNSVAFSSDGSYAAAACSDGTVQVWELKSGQVISLRGHERAVVSVAFSPTDGRRLASASADKTVRVWDLTTRQELLQCRGYEGPMRGAAYSVAFSADGRRLAAASEGGTVRIWDAAKGDLVHELANHEMRASCVAFSPDGRLVASGSWRGIVRLWNAKTGQCLSVLGGHTHPIGAVTFSPDSRRLAAANFDRLIDVWDTATGECLRTLSGHTGMILGLAFSADGRRLASGSEDRSVRIWDALSGREILQLAGHTKSCNCVAFSPDGQRLASAGRDATIRFWDASQLAGNEAEELRTFHEHNHEVWAVAINPAGTQVAAAGLDPIVRVWDMTTGQMTGALSENTDVVFDLAFGPDGQHLATAGIDGVAPQPFVVKLWDAQTRQPLSTLLRRSREIFAIAFSPRGDRLALALADGTVELADARTGLELGVFGKQDRDVHMRGLAFHPNGQRLASVGSEGTVNVWDLSPLGKTSPPQAAVALRSSGDAPFSIAYSPDGRRIVTGGMDGALTLWDAEKGEEIRTARGPFGGEIWTVAFSPDGRWIASAGADCTARMWDATSLQPIRAFRGHVGPIRCLAISRDGTFLVTSSADKTVKVWDTTPRKEVN